MKYKTQVEEEKPARRGWAISKSGILSYGFILAGEVELTDEEEVSAWKSVKNVA